MRTKIYLLSFGERCGLGRSKETVRIERKVMNENKKTETKCITSYHFFKHKQL